MKKTFVLLLLLFTFCASDAKKRTTEELKEIAASFMNKQQSGKPRKAKANPSEMRVAAQKEHLAVITNDDIFVVLAFDDEIEPVLGYSDTEFKEDTMPPGLQWWLNTTNEALDKGDRKEIARRAGVPAGLPSSVDSLITTKWWQSEPYNNKCPLGRVGKSNNFARCLTGCGVTAMAQVMNYHKYPEHGTGSHGYRTRDTIRIGDYEGDSLFMDFSEVYFDWQNMKDDYSARYSEAEADAVAELMFACGVASENKYGTEESSNYSWQIVDALSKYFCYEETCRREKSYNYFPQKTEKWLNRIYYNLKRKLPIIYVGYDNSKMVGHFFVFDGYNTNGLVHINWGWGGKYNGYFSIYSLSARGYDFSSEQEMICEIKPKTYSLEVREIHVSQPGELSSLLPESEYDFIEALKVSGDINGSDFTVLRNLCEAGTSNHFLYSLDLSDANIVAGGTFLYNNKSYNTKKDVFPEHAFHGCMGIYGIILPQSITSIGNDAFCGCENLKSIIIPENVTDASSSAFTGSRWFNDQPDGLLYIGKVAYKYKGAMPEGTEIVIKDGTKRIADDCFSGCTGLTSVIIPNSVTTIGDNAFSRCTNLTSVSIPEGVASIGDKAFLSCYKMISVIIPNSIISIGKSAFENCYGLTSVYISDLLSWCNISFDNNYSQPLTCAHHLYLNGQEIQGLVIPDCMKNIGNYTFCGGSNFASVIIPDGVTSIGRGAFQGCVGLTSVSIPKGVNRIGPDAFRNCIGLTSVHISDLLSWCKISFDSNYSQPLVYAHHLYLNGEEIQDLVIPDGLTSIGDSTFSGCQGLTTVNIPNGVMSIGNSAFSGCSNLVSVTIPQSVTSIEDYAFYECNELERVFCLSTTPPETKYNVFPMYNNATMLYVPATLYVPASALDNYSYTEPWSNFSVISAADLLSPVVIDGIKYELDVVAQTATVVANESNEEGYTGSVTIPAVIDVNGMRCSVTCIGNGVFCNSPDLTSVNIPESVTSIGESAFSGCLGMTYVVIPAGVKRIGERAFESCGNLKAVFCLGGDVPQAESNAFVNSSYGTATLYVASSAIYGRCRYTEPWMNFSEIKTWDDFVVNDIKYGLNVKEKTASVLPYYLRYSGSVTIPASLDISGVSFDVTAIGNEAFRDCYGLTSVVIPGSITDIGSRAFEHCSFMETITIPEGVTTIGSSAFESCYNLTSISFPNSVKSIGSYACKDCCGLTSVTFVDGATTTGYGTFWGCTNLQTVNLPSTMVILEDYAFISCSSLSDITIPENVTCIGYRTFEDCAALKSISIPSGVNNIGENAFSYCYNLASVTVDIAAPLDISEETFSNRAYATLYVPLGSEEAYAAAPYWKEFKEILPTVIIDDIAYTLDKENHTAKVISKRGGYTSTIDIPASINPNDEAYSVTSIEDWAFAGSNHLTSVSIPGSVTTIGKYAFYVCDKLNSVTFSDDLTSIGENAFNGCEALASIIIPNSVTRIGASAFKGCRSLISAVLSEGMASIQASTFSNCEELAFVTIPSKLFNIASSAFSYCTSLKEIYCYAVERPYVDFGAFEGVDVSKVMLVVPDESYEAYKAHGVWGQFWIETPTGIEVMDNGQLAIDNEGSWFDLSGRKVTNPQKGIYIKDGRKMLIK